jgi:hypothetical protein
MYDLIALFQLGRQLLTSLGLFSSCHSKVVPLHPGPALNACIKAMDALPEYVYSPINLTFYLFMYYCLFCFVLFVCCCFSFFHLPFSRRTQHRIGVIYAGKGQTVEDIFANVDSSEDYNEFLATLGWPV